MSIKDQLNLAACCLDNLASGTLDAEGLTQEKLAAAKHVENLHNLADVVPELLAVLEAVYAATTFDGERSVINLDGKTQRLVAAAIAKAKGV